MRGTRSGEAGRGGGEVNDAGDMKSTTREEGVSKGDKWKVNDYLVTKAISRVTWDTLATKKNQKSKKGGVAGGGLAEEELEVPLLQ